MNTEKLKSWINNLDIVSLHKVALDSIVYLIGTEDVRLTDEGIPYWVSCGDSLDGNN